MHFLFRKIRLLSLVTNHSPYELFYGKKPLVDHLRPFGCLAYVHLQKDQHGALLPHVAQCIFISYLADYKAWCFWDPAAQKEIISNSAVFQESVFPFQRPGLSAVDKSVDPSPLIDVMTLALPAPEVLTTPQLPDDLDLTDTVPCLVPCLQPVEAPPPTPPVNLPEQPCLAPEIRNLMLHFEHHPAGQQLLPKCASHACCPSALVEAEDIFCTKSAEDIIVPILATMDFTLATAVLVKPETLAEAMAYPDAEK